MKAIHWRADIRTGGVEGRADRGVVARIEPHSWLIEVSDRAGTVIGTARAATLGAAKQKAEQVVRQAQRR